MRDNILLHGGNIYKEALHLGYDPSELLDFSANINPLGFPPNLLAHLSSCLDKCINYPDPDSTNLINKLAKYLGVGSENVCVGNGAIEIIYLIFQTLSIKKVLIPAPTFVEYEKAAITSGAEVIYYERLEENSFDINFNEMLNTALKKNVEAVLLCNPNNPTSTLESRENVLEFVYKCHDAGIKVIIDEAFIELTKKGKVNSVSSGILNYDNLYVIRAFTKIFAIPGIRLGYCISANDNIKELQSHQPSWPINTLASETGIVFDVDIDYIRRTNEWINIELDYLYGALDLIPQIKAYKPSTNFILCRMLNENWDAHRLKERLLKDKILIRNAANFVFLDNSYFRIAVKDRYCNNQLIHALESIDWR